MKRKLNISLVLFLICTLVLAQQPNSAVEVKVPNWVSSRPVSGFKYVGIGVASKLNSTNYQMEAKKNALYDLASEIKVDISTNSVLYTVQNNNQFNENFNSLIKLSNSDNIEGYTLVDTYENDKQYWAYYELDKDEYQKRKAEKKANTITKAANLINISFTDEQNKNFSGSLKKRIQAFGILSPYLSEEIVFDATKTKGIKNVFDLTNLIQTQLQSISIMQPSVMPVVKPYQPQYSPFNLKVLINGKVSLTDFPFDLKSDDELIKLEENTISNSNGELQIKVLHVEPQFQLSSITLNPDIERLTANDSVGKASISILKQFIQTPALKTQISIEPISLFISSKERNLGKDVESTMLQQFIQQKFMGNEIRITDLAKNADYIIESDANTSEDISSAILMKNYNLALTSLKIDLVLKNIKGEVVYKGQVNDIYGYANNLEKSGINAYSSNKLKSKLGEALFFLKRKMVVY